MLLLSPFLLLLLQCAYLYIYLFIYRGMFRAKSNIRMENWQKLLTAMAVGYFRKGFVWNVWLGSECVWNLFVLSYLSIIHVLLYLFIHLLFYLLTSVYVSRVYILAAFYYSHVLACFIIFVWKICIWRLL